MATPGCARWRRRGGAVLAARGPCTAHAHSVPSPGACARRRAPRAAGPRGRHHAATTGEYGVGISARPQHCAVWGRENGLTGCLTQVSARQAAGCYGLFRRLSPSSALRNVLPLPDCSGSRPPPPWRVLRSPLVGRSSGAGREGYN